jgi:CDP-paratose 2-epimerase
MPKSLLITGGAGFIGINAADHYLSRGDDVIILDNFSRDGTEKNLAWLRGKWADRVSVIRADIRHDQRALELAANRADVVLHLAAQVAVTTSVRAPREDFEINALGTLNVLEAVRQSERRPIVIYSSTNKVYGKMDDVAIDEGVHRYSYRGYPEGVAEDRPLDFYSPYGCSKGAGDQYVIDYGRIYGLRTVVFRQSCIYGPHQFGVEDQGWLAWFAIRAISELGVTVYGDGKQVRDALFVDDLIGAYDAAITAIDRVSGRAYNMGGGASNTLSLLELIGMLDERLGRRMPVAFDDWRPGDQKVFVADARKAEQELGWKARVGVEEGVDRMLAWLRENVSQIREVVGLAGARG